MNSFLTGWISAATIVVAADYIRLLFYSHKRIKELRNSLWQAQDEAERHLGVVKESRAAFDSLKRELTNEREVRTKLMDAIMKSNHAMSKQDAVIRDLRAQLSESLDRVTQNLPQRGSWESAARELQRRIDAFRRQSQRVKKAYCEDVFRISHGQVDKAALTDPEKYLVEMEDGVYKTAAQIVRDCEAAMRDRFPRPYVEEPKTQTPEAAAIVDVEAIPLDNPVREP